MIGCLRPVYQLEFRSFFLFFRSEPIALTWRQCLALSKA